MQSIHLSGLIVQPIAERIQFWSREGKISEDDLDDALTSDARALIDHSLGVRDWIPIKDVEGLVGLAADQIGGETGLVDWAEEIVQYWQSEETISRVIQVGRSLPDAPGFVVSQVSELVLRDANWTYDGGRSWFSVRLSGLGEASPALKSLIGALLAKLAVTPTVQAFDVRFDGVDGDDLVVFGETAEGDDDRRRESRLNQVALIA